ncbi:MULTISPECIES: hypothetical protein [unclassified Agarivorans]|uniref:hypothetical protein n=1 Tax=unclassified Agarivorans TaxID=2636026 RepID=UPI0026E30833|nr:MULTISPECIES: hypothetical protein [unclassified Agarivorans]MDO6683920.1 hypothetical protein [Agarivorans sp. 3_MG-2023]MDO6714347.1 hypothetical protein [Agarivorans sp. 2_MG-2023]
MNGILRLASVSLIILTSLGLTACNTSDRLLDHVDKPRTAKISYINAQPNATGFYLKSVAYSSDVFDSRFRVTQLNSASASKDLTHRWIESNNENQFAIENSNSRLERVRENKRLNHRGSYWAVAWHNNNLPQLSIFEKSTIHQQHNYYLRVFSNSQQVLKDQSRDINLATTEVGKVTDSFAFAQCNDAMLGEYTLDLCAIGELGGAYLVVANGSIVIVEEPQP